MRVSDVLRSPGESIHFHGDASGRIEGLQEMLSGPAIPKSFFQ